MALLRTCEGGVDEPQEEAESGKSSVGRLFVIVIRRRRPTDEHSEQDQHRLRHDDHDAQEESYREGSSVPTHYKRTAH